LRVKISSRSRDFNVAATATVPAFVCDIVGASASLGDRNPT